MKKSFLTYLRLFNISLIKFEIKSNPEQYSFKVSDLDQCIKKIVCNEKYQTNKKQPQN